MTLAPARVATGTPAAAPAPLKMSPRVTTPSASKALAFSVTGVAARAGEAAARAARNTSAFIGLRLQLVGGGEHVVGGGDDLGVHLVGALGDDQGRDFGDRVDVGGFGVALLQGADADRARRAGGGGARGGGFLQQV